MAYLSIIAHFLLYHKALFIVNMILVFFYIFLDFFLKICYIFRYSKLFPFEQYLFFRNNFYIISS